MDLFGLNWQLQENDSYGTFGNDVEVRDPISNTIMVSGDNGEFLQLYQNISSYIKNNHAVVGSLT